MRAKDIIRKITDVMTVAFPAIISVMVVLNATGVVEIARVVEQITFIALGAASAIASVVYNWAAAPDKEEVNG